MKNIFKKTVMLALGVALGAASLPIVNVAAMGAKEPPAPQGDVSNQRLEKVWERQLHLYERIGNGFDRSDTFIERVQGLIDHASENDKDISAVQAALSAFEQSIKDVRPLYESAKGIINSHQGFDADGKVTDAEKAKETVKAMGEKLKEIKDAMNGTGKALKDAIHAFREANPRPERNAPAS